MRKVSPRRRAREFAVQALYQSRINDTAAPEIARHIRENLDEEFAPEFNKLSDKHAELAASEPPLEAEDLESRLAKIQKKTEILTTQKESINELFSNIFFGVHNNRIEYMNHIRPLLDRDEKDITPIEQSVLLMAVHELKAMPETPYPVIINEAIEITKTFGGTDSHKFINGILDRLAAALRPNDPKRRA